MTEEDQGLAKPVGSKRKRRATAEQGSLQTPPAPLPVAPARPPEAGPLFERLIGRNASEILARISNGDPLGLYPLGAHRIRERYLVIDPDRVFERTLAMVAVGMEIEKEECRRPDWLVAMIDRAIRTALEEDREAERSGAGPGDFLDPRYRVFVEAFGTEPALARSAAVRFNGLEDRTRQGFFHLLVDGQSVEACLELGLGPRERLRHDILTALWALGHLDDAELEEMKTRKQS